MIPEPLYVVNCSCALAFTVSGEAVAADLAKLSPAVRARWFDPVNGELKVIEGSPFSIAGSHQFTPPGQNAGGDSDWLLVLDEELKPSPPPTSR